MNRFVFALLYRFLMSKPEPIAGALHVKNLANFCDHVLDATIVCLTYVAGQMQRKIAHVHRWSEMNQTRVGIEIETMSGHHCYVICAGEQRRNELE